MLVETREEVSPFDPVGDAGSERTTAGAVPGAAALTVSTVIVQDIRRNNETGM